ncbi:hypothetical protein JHW43_005669 [Diplocarpon mali]|nr:hypothetical protein JHW43_005669 [Diplocarpon mali]
MASSTEPTAILSHLHRTDGSATFSQNGFTVIGAVNGPLEIQRRDELPEEAAIDVLVRPAAGAGGTRERHLESILQATLRQIILIHNFPRTLYQVTLQITKPTNPSSAPSNCTTGSVIRNGSIIVNPTPLESQSAASIHVLAFSSHGELLVAESEGSFTLKDWQAVFDAGKKICCDELKPGEDQAMDDGEQDRSLMMFVQSTLEDKVKTDLQWKG